MKVSLERLPESRVSVAIEVDQERVDKSLDEAYRRLAPRTRIPGFRPGKAPRHMVERQIGQQRLMSEALDTLVPDVYNEAIETEDVAAIGQPELESVELEPVRLKFTVPVRPTIDLGDYRAVRVEKAPVEVTDEMVEEQLSLIRRRYATHVPVERAAEWNDILTADVTGAVEDDQFIKDENAEFPLREGQTLLVEGLAEAFVGMSKGETKSVELGMDEDFQVERFQGKTASFTLTVNEVKEEQLPDEDDEFANQVNADEFPTFDSLKERITTDLTDELQRQADAAFQSEAIEKIVDGATIEFPQVLVEREIDHVIRDSMGGDGQQYAAYLARVGRSEQEYRDSLRPLAETRVKRSLVLSELAEQEGVEVTHEEIDAELDEMVAPMGDEADKMREIFRSAEGEATIRRSILNKKILERISAIASGEAPGVEEPQEEPA